jgi:hypothetical protein
LGHSLWLSEQLQNLVMLLGARLQSCTLSFSIHED